MYVRIKYRRTNLRSQEHRLQRKNANRATLGQKGDPLTPWRFKHYTLTVKQGSCIGTEHASLIRLHNNSVNSRSLSPI